MNQAPAGRPQINGISSENLFEKAFDSQREFEKPEVEDNSVVHSEESLKSMGNDWVEFMSRTTEGPVTKVEIEQTAIETQFSQPLKIFETDETAVDSKPLDIIEKQKGSGSAFVEYGRKVIPEFKDLWKSTLGALSLITELFMDTASLFIPKKDKRAEKPEADPEKARAKAEKKAENQRKQNNIKAFYEGLKTQISAVVSPDGLRMETQEKANINLTAKIGQESYNGIKDAFGRLTVYALSMFERAQLDQEKQSKKIEKENKMASVTKGPDLNLDKVAEGGFLSSTGGQGAG